MMENSNPELAVWVIKQAFHEPGTSPSSTGRGPTRGCIAESPSLLTVVDSRRSKPSYLIEEIPVLDQGFIGL